MTFAAARQYAQHAQSPTYYRGFSACWSAKNSPVVDRVFGSLAFANRPAEHEPTRLAVIACGVQAATSKRQRLLRRPYQLAESSFPRKTISIQGSPPITVSSCSGSMARAGMTPTCMPASASGAFAVWPPAGSAMRSFARRPAAPWRGHPGTRQGGRSCRTTTSRPVLSRPCTRVWISARRPGGMDS